MEISYKVEGLHSLNSMPYINLKPVTLLVGYNNSGKSSFLRSLPLIQQSRLLGNINDCGVPISWTGPLVDLTSFSNSVNKNLQDEEITFRFKISDFQLDEILPDYDDRNFLQDNLEIIDVLFPEISENSFLLNDICYSVTVKEYKGDNEIVYTTFKNISIFVSSTKLNCEIKFSDNGEQIDYVKINNNNLSNILNFSEIKYSNNTILLEKIFMTFSIEKLNEEIFGSSNLVDDSSNNGLHIHNLLEVFKRVNKVIFDGDTASQFCKMINSSYLSKIFGSRKENENRANKEENKKNIDELPKKQIEILKLYGQVLLLWFVNHRIQLMLRETISKLDYLGPARKIGKQQLVGAIPNVNKLDPQGFNFSNFLVAMGEKRISMLSDWIRELFGYGLEIERINGQIDINVNFGKKKYNFSNSGDGVSQVLPVLAQIWWTNNKPPVKPWSNENIIHAPQIIAMEHPELQLHPVQQAKLAVAIIDMIAKKETPKSPNPRFIVETHSETLLSKFSDLIRERKVKHTEVQVIVFSIKDDDSAESTVKVCEFNEDGRLENWPLGFFNSG